MVMICDVMFVEEKVVAMASGVTVGHRSCPHPADTHGQPTYSMVDATRGRHFVVSGADHASEHHVWR